MEFLRILRQTLKNVGGGGIPRKQRFEEEGKKFIKPFSFQGWGQGFLKYILEYHFLETLVGVRVLLCGKYQEMRGVCHASRCATRASSSVYFAQRVKKYDREVVMKTFFFSILFFLLLSLLLLCYVKIASNSLVCVKGIEALCLLRTKSFKGKNWNWQQEMNVDHSSKAIKVQVHI